MMNETKKGFIQLHLSVMLAGFTGLFGRLVTLNEVDIVWYRMLFTSLILLVFTGLPRVGWKKFLQLCGCGALLGFHWILFFGSIKASNVSIGVVCFSLIGFFTALFEPLLFKKKAVNGWQCPLGSCVGIGWRNRLGGCCPQVGWREGFAKPDTSP